MFNVMIELQRDTALLFNTDNQQLAKELMRLEFIPHWKISYPRRLGKRIDLEPYIIVTDEHGYKSLQSLEELINELDRSERLGRFIIAAQHWDGERRVWQWLQSTNHYNEQMEQIVKVWMTQPISNYKKGIVIKVGNLIKSIYEPTFKEIFEPMPDIAADDSTVKANDDEGFRIAEAVELTQVEEPEESRIPEAREPREEKDHVYEQAVQLVISTRQASVSLLQRRLRIGYTRAARYIDQMEQEGIVGPYEGSKPRQVLYREDKPPEMVN